MKKIYAVITKQVYRNEESYASFLTSFESTNNLTIDNITANRCMNRPEEIVLEIAYKAQENKLK